MKTTFFVCASVLVAVCAAYDLEAVFHNYVDTFGKTYTSRDEFEYRMTVFAANMNRIAHDNAAAAGETTFAMNKFTDLTPEEFKKTYTGFRPSAHHAAIKAAMPEVAFAGNKDVKQVDWRTKGLVTPVKDQGQCGSCWAFSATEQIESDVLRRGLKEVVLAPQQIVSCDKVDAGCGGGDTPTAYDYVKKAGGMMPESEYPYKSGISGDNGKCKFEAPEVVANITSFSYVSKSGKEELTKMKTYVGSTGPVSVCLATGGWQSYSSGILKRGCGGAADVDHCVQVVGYNDDEKEPYWIVRNSWNTDWGVKGFIYVSMGDNTCDIAGEATVTVSQ